MATDNKPQLEIQVEIEGIKLPLPSTFTAQMWCTRDNAGPFSALPAIAESIRIPHRSLFMNAFGDNARQEASLSLAQAWGPDDMGRPLYARAIAKDGTRFCLRFAFDVRHATRNQRPNNFQFYQRLLKDAEFHSKHLQDAAGIFVPLHYGIWIMETGDWAGTVMFSLTQWCGISWKSLVRTKLNNAANCVLVGRTFEMLHDIGVNLNGSMGVKGDLRQVLLDVDDPWMTREDFETGRARCFVVGFSEATIHVCERKVPVLPLGSLVFPQHLGCHELGNLCFLLGFMDRTDENFASQALQWHETYSDQHPNDANSSVLMAQRERLFPRYKAVYPGLRVSFQEPKKLYSQVILSDSSETGLPVGLPIGSADSWSRPQLASRILGKYFSYGLRPAKPDSAKSSSGGSG
ncbi:hypothetical protein C8F01DRAFT_1113377 [Mycena amicta]|nr:hypothetical protein C8F01DRAFT_1113377 [Mycena amicta]